MKNCRSLTNLADRSSLQDEESEVNLGFKAAMNEDEEDECDSNPQLEVR